MAGSAWLYKKCKPGLVIGLCDCALTPPTPHILLWNSWHWSILIQSVKSLMLSMCYLAALQRRRMFPNVPWWEFISCKSSPLTQFSCLPLIRDNITCFGLCTPPWQFEKRKKKHSPLEAKDRFITRILDTINTVFSLFHFSPLNPT